MALAPMRWSDGVLLVLDQRELPAREVWLGLQSAEDVAVAIREMAVRGAPAIGVAAAYGMALAALRGDYLAAADACMRASRPTAVNLAWALDRMRPLWGSSAARLLEEAQRIEAEDVAINQAIGRHGAALVPQGAGVLTICNTGSLATAGHGTALGIIRTAHEDAKAIRVLACETRPRQQGLRLTAWELAQDGIPFAVIADSAAGRMMATGEVGLVVVGADRIAANGDTANKIGTYSLAVLANHHGIPFLVAAPTSTVDSALPDGASIPIEERDPSELTHVDCHRVAPEGCPVMNPAFDVTPADLIGAIVTELGVHCAPYDFSDLGR
ncbi:MAG: S-methyl-5-thioribose-1-phosphate isomerase [Fimbriimonas ginsengisoli]|uniref:Methylthioribose-1-phosphate isomerase n=1 Tax=Fimbriimonas ginsengisoli TaxID=1005039 RepID=A0A931LS65_FIMGI|nr:S-methyl-5-thioribose-1-phosphate isomerase [Fimbriimonas ginsengisoli]